MKWKQMAIVILTGLTLGALLADLPLSQAASGKKKQCGGAGGATNGQCPKCIGNCWFEDGNPPQSQKYKICQDTGDKCEDTVDTFCSGTLMTGGTDGKGCDGDIELDDFGLYVTCQNSKFKTCK